MQDVKVPSIKSLIIHLKENNQKPKMFNYCLYIWYRQNKILRPIL